MPVVFTMGNFFNYNGKVYPQDTTIIGPENRGLRYGDGLFETIKLKNNQLLFIDHHLDRLWKGMQVLGFNIPAHFTESYLSDQILSLAKKNKLENARIRLSVFRGDGGINDAVDHFPNFTIQVWDLNADIGKWNTNGLVLGINNSTKKSIDVLSNLKHNNYLPNVLAAIYAKKEKWNDAVLLNTFDRVCETTIANIFFIKNKIIYTPALSEGCVAGVMRNFLVNEIKRHGFDLKEDEVTVESLLDADEVFVSNSINNIRWVQSIADKKFTHSMSHEIYSKIISTIL